MQDNLSKLALLACISFAPGTVIANQYVGELYEITTPSSVKIELNSNQLMELHLVGPDFGSFKNTRCQANEAAELRCEMLSEILEGKTLGIVIEQVEGATMFGDIVVDSEALSLRLVQEGLYRVDYTHNRSLALLAAEAESRCHYRGIWAKYKGNYEVARSCMGW